MNILCVQPPVEDFYDTSIRTYPLGLLYLAAAVSDMATVHVADLRTGYPPKMISPGKHPFPDLAPFYRDDITSPFGLFRRYQRFGATTDQIASLIASATPDLLAVSSLFSAYSAQALEVAAIAKAIDPAIITVLGGIHPTLFPREVLAHGSVDYVIRGEGETPFRRLAEALTQGRRNDMASIPGLSFREAKGVHIGSVHHEQTMDLIPDRTIVDPSRYRIGRRTITSVATSRGCPFHCAFCGKPPGPYRTRSLTTIGDEADQIMELGIEAVDFTDDMLTLDRKRFAAVLDIYAPRRLTLSAMNGLYAETLNENILNLMFAAGFRRLNFSLVDLAPAVLATEGRNALPKLLDLLPWLETSPFLTEVHFIAGLPGQRPAELLETLLFLMEKRVLLAPSIFYAAPGSPHFGSSAAIPFSHMRSSAMFGSSPQWTKPALATIVRLSRFITYVKGIIDRTDGIETLHDVIAFLATEGRTSEREILSALYNDGQFMAARKRGKGLVVEIGERDLVRLFFERARGKRIKGFKSSRSIGIS